MFIMAWQISTETLQNSIHKIEIEAELKYLPVASGCCHRVIKIREQRKFFDHHNNNNNNNKKINNNNINNNNSNNVSSLSDVQARTGPNAGGNYILTVSSCIPQLQFDVASNGKISLSEFL